MNALLLAKAIDALNEAVGAGVKWLVLLAVIICTGNASMRYLFSIGSNAFLEAQWYLYGAVFMLYAGLALKRNQHVRIDILASRFSPRGLAWLDLAGALAFLFPVMGLMFYYSCAMALSSLVSGEVSNDAGGLIVWPAKMLMPIGFGLLLLQALSEVIKRVAFLRGQIEDPHPRSNALEDTTELEQTIKAIAEEKSLGMSAPREPQAK
jgi:TRAP-type mannitol/chloroaromatic compound transport system permease small subunit